MHKHIIIKTRNDTIKEAETKLKAILVGIDISETEEHNLLVSASEAVNNAVTHGNKNDPAKNVILNLDYADDEITLSIEDEGGGFNPEGLPDPLLPENLLKPSGRGIHIMKSLMDSVRFEFTRRGTRTVMKLKLKGAD
ncbi:MAG: ATP-binding protein [Bacteroidetes bacterium]|nr:ATP-binding protein [Bacteroidota bacterium]